MYMIKKKVCFFLFVLLLCMFLCTSKAEIFSRSNTSTLLNRFFAFETDDGWRLVDPSGMISFPSTFEDFIDNVYSEPALAMVKQEGLWYIMDEAGVCRGGYTTINTMLDPNDFSEPRDVFCLESSSDRIIVERDGMYGFMNTIGTAVVPCKYDSVEPFCDGLSLVEKNGKYGYITPDGAETIPLQYDAAQTFSKGLALVQKDGVYSSIDRYGTTLSTFSLDEYSSVGPLSEGFAWVEKTDDVQAAEHVGIKYGFIDHTGKLVIPCQYEIVCNFQDGLAAVSQDSIFFVFINELNQITIPFQFDNVSGFEGGKTRVTMDLYDGYIDKTGNFVMPCRYQFYQDYTKGLAFAGVSFPNENYIEGTINEIGELIIPFEYEGPERIRTGLSYKRVDDSYVIVDENRSRISSFTFNYASPFSEGLSRVSYLKSGFMNKEGRLVIPMVYDDATNFKNGFAEVKINGKWGLINKIGTLVVPCDYIAVFTTDEHVILLKEDNWIVCALSDFMI